MPGFALSLASHLPASVARPASAVAGALLALLLPHATPAAEFDLDAFERQVDATLRAACHGYVVDMIPDALAGIRSWLYEESPVCVVVKNLPKDQPLRDRFANLPMSQKDVARIYDRDAWRYPSGQGAVDQQIGFECAMEYMCITQRRRLSRTPHPVSQSQYDQVAASCKDELSEYHCIEKFFAGWPQPLPAAPASMTLPDASTNSLDQMLAGADEAIDHHREQARMKAAHEAEMARLERERAAALAAMEKEKKRLVAQAKREQARAQKKKETNWLGMGIALAGGAALASQSGMSSAGKLEFLTKYSAGVITKQDPAAFRAALGETATRELTRQEQRIKSLEAEMERRRVEQERIFEESSRAYREGAQRSYENAQAQGIQTEDPAKLSKQFGGSDWARAQLSQPVAGLGGQRQTVAQAPAAVPSAQCSAAPDGGPTVGPHSLLESKYLGTYRMDISSADYWTLSPGGSGTWGVGRVDGNHQRVAISWQPMADSNCAIQRMSQGGRDSVLVYVKYQGALSELVKRTMNSSGRDKPHNMLRLACEGSRCEAQFYGQMNAFYMK